MLIWGFVIGLIFIIIAPIVGGWFETLPVKKEKDRTISVDSAISFRDVAAYEINIKTNQKYIIKFSVHSENVTASLKIFGKGSFNSEYQKNTTNAPQTVTGRYFLVSKPSWVYDPSVSKDTLAIVTADQDDFYFIEFMGDGQSANDLIWNEPGDYMIVVYGTNSFVNNTNVTFNIEIYKSGPSAEIEDVFLYTGWIILILTGLVTIMKIWKQWTGAQ